MELNGKHFLQRAEYLNRKKTFTAHFSHRKKSWFVRPKLKEKNIFVVVSCKMCDFKNSDVFRFAVWREEAAHKACWLPQKWGGAWNPC